MPAIEFDPPEVALTTVEIGNRSSSVTVVVRPRAHDVRSFSTTPDAADWWAVATERSSPEEIARGIAFRLHFSLKPDAMTLGPGIHGGLCSVTVDGIGYLLPIQVEVARHPTSPTTGKYVGSSGNWRSTGGSSTPPSQPSVAFLRRTAPPLPVQTRFPPPRSPKPPPTSVPPRTAHRGSPKPNKPKPSVKTPASKASASSGSSPHENTFVQMYAWFVVMALAGIYIWLAGHFDAHSDELAAEPDLKGADLKDIEHFNQILEFRPAVISIAVVAVALGLLEAFAVSRQAHQGLILLLGVADACVSFSAGFIAVGLGYMWPYSITLSKYGLTSGWWLLFNLAGIVGVIIGGILLIAWWVFCVYNLVVAVGDALRDNHAATIGPSARWRNLNSRSATRSSTIGEYVGPMVFFLVALAILVLWVILGIRIASDIGDPDADVNASAIECPDVGRFNMADGFGTARTHNC